MPDKELHGTFPFCGHDVKIQTSPVPSTEDDPVAYALGLRLEELGVENLHGVEPRETRLEHRLARAVTDVARDPDGDRRERRARLAADAIVDRVEDADRVMPVLVMLLREVKDRGLQMHRAEQEAGQDA